MNAKNREKIQLLASRLSWTRTWEKNYDFAHFGRKIKINLELVGMLQNFGDTSIKIYIEDLQISVAFRISLDLF
jgi:hypothetical protein